MAIQKCPECKKIVSSKARACPNCGAPVTKKRTGCVLTIFILIGIIVAFGVLSNKLSYLGTTTTTPYTPKEEALNLVKLDYSWSTSAGGSLMKADFTISNNSAYDIQDIEIECTHYAKSGTEIDSNTVTIYNIVDKRSSKSFNDFDMGFINSQAYETSCDITDISIE